MEKELHEIKKENVTLLVNQSNISYQFELAGFYLNDNPEKVFKASYYGKNVETDKVIHIVDYLYNKLKQQADKELEEYINNNIEDTSIYVEDSEYEGRKKFWNSLNKVKKDFNTEKMYRGKAEVFYGDIFENKITFDINYTEFTFDLIKDEFVNIDSGKSPFDVFYSRRKKDILVTEQYKQGKTPEAYNYIIELKDFLKGKKSVRVLLKEGTEIKLKRNKITPEILLTYKNNCFNIYDLYFDNTINEPIPISKVKCLKYNSSTFDVPDKLAIK